VFEEFSDGAGRVVVHAQEAGRLFRHDCIGTEHLLGPDREVSRSRRGHVPCCHLNEGECDRQQR
jgi:hypothetical protein